MNDVLSYAQAGRFRASRAQKQCDGFGNPEVEPSRRALSRVPRASRHPIFVPDHHFHALHQPSCIANRLNARTLSTTSDTREEMPRISVDKLQDWERIKRSYTSAAYTTLEARIASRSEADKRMLRGQLQRVCISV